MSNAEIFRKAADYIREHGWTQDGFGRNGQPRCVLGAVRSVVGVPLRIGWKHDPQLKTVMPLMEERLGVSGHYGLTGWNDAPGRRKKHVLTLLDSLADDEELKDQIASLPPTVKEPLPVG